MQYVNAGAANFQNIVARRLVRPCFSVDVSAHRRDWRNRSEPRQDRRVPNITGVDDMVCSLERGQRFGAQQTVRIGDDADDALSFCVIRGQFSDSATAYVRNLQSSH